jgi:light-regulated signal transduction histidine kinase (bacteriophytochrome)
MTNDWIGIMPRLLHDAKALLRRPAMKAQLLSRQSSDTEIQAGAGKELLAAVVEGHHDLDRFFNRISLLAEVMGNHNEVEIPLAVAVAGAKAAMSSSALKMGGRIQVSEMPVCSVPAKLQIVLEELIQNSLTFAIPERNLLIHIGVQFNDRQLIIDYSDNASGWDPQYTARIFQPFEKLNNAKPGFGLGLAIASAVVQRHGGDISATTSDSGSSFAIQLPAAVV